MRFLLDAHLPRSLVGFFKQHGHEAVHVSTLPNGYDTIDEDIIIYAENNDCIVVSKDSDFVNAVRATGKPGKLLAIKLGNCSNALLMETLADRMGEIEKCMIEAVVVELHQAFLVVSTQRSAE